ncbi:MAG: hypothetical protein NW206_19175 [Hyphomonadaceae bacterium]|nr:hypothetical protein [Hyphomonadaceae bacterium]
MMKDIIVLAASTAIVIFMVIVAAALGFRARKRVDAAELERLVALSEPGARIANLACADDGAAALAQLADGKLAIAKAMADRVTLRLHAPDLVKLRVEPGSVRVTFADLGFPALHIKLNNPPSWLADLAAGGGGHA